jgi:hypothetical protein
MFPPFIASEDLKEQEVLQKAAEKANQNEQKALNYGFKLQTIIKKMDTDGKLEEQIQRDSHIIWLEGKPYNELLQINGQSLDSKAKAEEFKRKSEFIKTVRENKKTLRESLTWTELFKKYDFAFLPPDGEAQYLISFKPKSDNLPERNVYEKVFNHIAGKAWIDGQFNLLRAEAWLTESIRFGFGIFGKIDGISFTYTQKEYEQVWLPLAFYLKYKARRFLFNDNQEITTRFYDFYPRSDLHQGKPAGTNQH